MHRTIWHVTILSVLITILHVSSLFGAEFYKDKVIQVIVGYSPGGGFDTYTRAIARHIGKHIPGNPSVAVQNMGGAGSLIAANHVYKRAKPDGLTAGNFIGGLLLGQVLGRPGIEFDALKFEYIGVPARESIACALTKASGITTIEKWKDSKKPVTLGGTGPGATDDVPMILQAVLGLPIRLVRGYKGTSEIRMAAEGREIDGACWQWESISVIWREALATGDVVIPLQANSKPHPALPGVANAIDLVKTDEARQFIQAGIHDQAALTRLYVLPPGTPTEHVQILRKAFTETLKDPDFLADAKKAGLAINPVSGEEVEDIVRGLFKMPREFVTKLSKVLN